MVTVIFLRVGGAKRWGFLKVIIWGRQVTKGGLSFIGGVDPFRNHVLKNRSQNCTTRVPILTQLTFPWVLYKVVQYIKTKLEVKSNLPEFKGSKGSFTYDISRKIKKFNPFLSPFKKNNSLWSKIQKKSECVRTTLSLSPSLLTSYANNS